MDLFQSRDGVSDLFRRFTTGSDTYFINLKIVTEDHATHHNLSVPSSVTTETLYSMIQSTLNSTKFYLTLMVKSIFALVSVIA